MRISRIQIENFRNFHHFAVELSNSIVIVGENKIGKSNLLQALRLVLDPSLPDTARQLRDEDFWDGLPRPLSKEHRIIVSVDLADFEDDENLKALLVDHLISPEPMISRLTYVYHPLPTLEGNPSKESDYEFFIYGGGRPENRIRYEVIRRIPLDVLPALRDAEADLANWRRSPLRPLLDSATRQVDLAGLAAIAERISKVTTEVAEIDQIRALGSQLNSKLVEIIGSSHAVTTELGFAPTDPERLIRALRLFVDGRKRGIGESSLGSANLLYLTLKTLELEQLVQENSRNHTFWAIEEPEAHLHPHLQRLVYRKFLHQRGQPPEAATTGPSWIQGTTVLLTTHSPHIVSVTPLRSLVMLRRKSSEQSTEGVSTANLELDESDVADLERYIDVTRGELLFAKAVILVEGEAEKFVVPVLGKLLGVDFDQLGITVCSVAGTNFTPYVKFLGPAGLDVPFAVLTDLDPQDDGTDLGSKRVSQLVLELLGPKKSNGLTEEQLLELAPGKGVFLNEYTFEVDLFRCGRHKSMSKTLAELTSNGAARKRAETWLSNSKDFDPEQFLQDIEAIGKARFAQRLATRLKGTPCPTCIKDAIQYVCNALR